ncbi:MAG: hypothetical protein HWN68_03335 [Desulfobacterales bacterium]|nr:hypothetical protein [Desulfobacterales bacterium]
MNIRKLGLEPFLIEAREFLNGTIGINDVVKPQPLTNFSPRSCVYLILDDINKNRAERPEFLDIGSRLGWVE